MRRVLTALFLVWCSGAWGQVPTGHFTYAFTTQLLWDVTGTYTNDVDPTDLVIANLEHSGNGAISGDRTETYYADSNNNSQGTGAITGKVSSRSIGVAIQVKWVGPYSGIASGRVFSATVTSTSVSVIDTNDLTVRGVSGTTRACYVGGRCENVMLTGPPSLPLPVTIDGSWSLAIDLAAVGTKLSGTGTVTLSNARTFSYAVSGSYKAPNTKLRLVGTGDAKGSSLTLVGQGPDLIISSMRGKILGQKIALP